MINPTAPEYFEISGWGIKIQALTNSKKFSPNPILLYVTGLDISSEQFSLSEILKGFCYSTVNLLEKFINLLRSSIIVMVGGIHTLIFVKIETQVTQAET